MNKKSLVSLEDIAESKVVVDIIIRVDAIDEFYVNTESEILSKKQPFLISLLLGYRFDLNEFELEEVMKIIFVIWEYFKKYDKVNKVKISKRVFEKKQKGNMQMLNSIEDNVDTNYKNDVITSDLNNLKSKALLVGVLSIFNHKKALIDLDEEKKDVIIIGMKSIIECFDDILQK